MSVADGADTARRCARSRRRRRSVPVLSAPLDGVAVVHGAEALRLYSFGTCTHRCRRSDPEQYGVTIFGIEGMELAIYKPPRWHDGVKNPADGFGG